MCLSQAGRIQWMDEDGGEALVGVDGRPRRVSLAPIVLDGITARIGDWVLIHTGLAVAVIDETAARRLCALVDQARASDP